MDNLTRHSGVEKNRMKIAELVATKKERGVPVVYERFSIEETIDTLLKFRHSRLVYVLNDNDELTGTISLGMLMRHSLSPKYEPKIHPRLLIRNAYCRDRKGYYAGESGICVRR